MKAQYLNITLRYAKKTRKLGNLDLLWFGFRYFPKNTDSYRNEVVFRM